MARKLRRLEREAPMALPLPRPGDRRPKEMTWWGIDPCAILAIGCAAASMVLWAGSFGSDAVLFGAMSLDRLRAHRWMAGKPLAWAGLLIGLSALISATWPVPQLKR